MKNDRFVVVHVGMWKDRLLKENNAANATIKIACEFLVASWEPTTALHLKKQAENALVKVDYSLVDVRQHFGMRVAAFGAAERDTIAAG
jgi:hypothetical protein